MSDTVSQLTAPSPLIWAVDPGTEVSGWVVLNPDTRGIVNFGKERNFALLHKLLYKADRETTLVIERIVSYGRPVGQETFCTCEWIGRFWQAWLTCNSHVRAICRRDVKEHLCGGGKGVTDAVIRQRLIDLWGGREKAIGRKKTPGPLYGITKDCWQALAVAVTASERPNL